MKAITWVIFGATSIIAEEFARLAAQAGHNLILVGRDQSQLEIIAADLALRYHINSEVISYDFERSINRLITNLMNRDKELAFFIGHSLILENNQLTFKSIEALIKINVLSTIQLIQAYFNKSQTQHRLVFLSSVAACRGRAKNSLYGASKGAVEIFLQGLQQEATPEQWITVANLGFIDTVQTFGVTNFSASPKSCAKACWKASYAGKRQIYYPFFWRYIMMIIKNLPFFLYRKLKL